MGLYHWLHLMGRDVDYILGFCPISNTFFIGVDCHQYRFVCPIIFVLFKAFDTLRMRQATVRNVRRRWQTEIRDGTSEQNISRTD